MPKRPSLAVALPTALLLLLTCGRRPCEPWISNGLEELAAGPGVRIEHCSSARLRWRVIPGGTWDGWLNTASTMEYSGWRLWNRRAWVRKGEVAMAVVGRTSRDDLVVELFPDPSVDVAAALRALAAPDGGS